MREGLQKFTKSGIVLRERFSKGMIIRSLIVFILSIVVFSVTPNYYLQGLAGLGLIISGSIIALFILIFLIFFFLEKSLEKHNAKQETIKKKVAKKVVSKKKVATKKKK